MKRRAFMHVVGLVMTLVLLLSPIAPVRATAPGPRMMSETMTEGPTAPLRPVVQHDVWHGVSAPVRSLPQPTIDEVRGVRETPFHAIPRMWGGKESTHPATSYQDWLGAPTAMPAPLMSFEGLSNTSGVLPPDTNGDVGRTYYIQSVNATIIGIYDKSTGNLVQSFSLGSLWPSGDPCNSNDGDPIVLYDQLADRWMLSQFALPNFPNGPYYQCIAVSKSNDPLGEWYAYTYQVHDTKMNDYPHFGVWPDAYYMTANQFTNGSSWGGAGVWAFDRESMLNGSAGTFVYFDLEPVNSDYGGMLPADFDGITPPPNGAPGLFVEWDDSSWIGPNDALRVWEFHVDWDTPSNSTFGVNGDPNYVIQTENVDPDMCGGSRNCIPQPGGSALDAIADRLMYRVQYRNFGSYQSLVSNHTVDVDGNDHAGIHWFELRDEGSGWAMYQEGIFAPDADHRWMGSIAVDHVGNMALGYSVSSASTYPSIRYAGRLAGDPVGTLPQGEGEIVAGSGYQESSYGRWGDYSMMGVDPVDDCTFWYTQEYYATIGNAPWQTRIGSFKFPNCSLGPQGRINGIVYDASGSPASDPIAQADIYAASSPTVTYHTASGQDGAYTFILPTGTYTLSAATYGYLPTTITGVSVVSGTTTTVNIPMTATTSYVISGTVTDAMAGWPLYAHITIDGDPVSPPSSVGDFWNDPVTGFYSVTLATGITYTLHVSPWVSGYDARSIEIPPLTADQTVNITFTADMTACTAPGYGMSSGLRETFDATTIPDGWTVIDNAGTGAVWAFDNPGGRSNNTGGEGNFAIADSDAAESVDMDTELRTPLMDFSSVPSVTLQFKYDFNSYSDVEVADVDVSNDGGTTWTNVWHRSGADDRGPKTAVVDISSIAGGHANVMVRFHYYNANYDWYWEVDDVQIGDPGCALQPGGLVVGNTYDENTNLALAGSNVESDSGSHVTSAATPDPHVDDAFYTLFLPTGTHTMTATHGGGYAPDVISVTPVQSSTISQDFYLPAGMLDYAPKTLSATLEMGEVVTKTWTLSNSGSVATPFELIEMDRGMQVYAPISLPPAAPHFDHTPPSMERAPSAQYVGGQGFDLAPLAGEPAFAFDIYPGSDLVFITDTTAPGSWNVIGSVSGAPFAADFLYGDFSTLYMLDYSSNQLFTVDTATGAATAVGSATPSGGEAWTGMAGSPDGTLYVASTSCSHSTLYTIDPDTAALTEIGEITNAPCIIAIATDATGQEMYGLDLAGDNLIKIDPATGAGTVIGSVGFDANYAQGMDFEETSGVLYLAAYNNGTGQGELRIADTSTGNTALVGAFPGGDEVDGLAFATGGAIDVPWLAEEPVSGTVAASSSVPVSVTFDAGQVAQPGTYYARLKVLEQTPYNLDTVPVTMTVLPPDTWGKITGVVSSSGHCGTAYAPLDGAQVLVQGAETYTLTTESDGSYAWWMTAGTYTVTVSADGHLSQTTQITVTQQETTTHNFTLEVIQPCPEHMPQAFDVAVMPAEMLTQTLMLSNSGHLSYTFQLHEMPPSAGTDYTVSVSGASGGPVYNWIEITPTAPITIALGDDASAGPFSIGFDFPFYGDIYDDIYVNSNGFLSFGSGSTAYSNQCPLPNSAAPNNLIALMWDDLNPSSTHDLVYYQSFSTCPYGGQGACLVVEYDNYHHYGGNVAGTFQAILFDYGSVLIQFKDAGAEQGSGSTTGIENADGTQGLSYHCNTAVLTDSMALCFAAPGAPTDCSAPDVPWLSETPITGTVDVGSSFPISITFDATGMSAGVYTATLLVSTSDPLSSSISIPVTMTVGGPIYLPLVAKNMHP